MWTTDLHTLCFDLNQPNSKEDGGILNNRLINVTGSMILQIIDIIQDNNHQPESKCSEEITGVQLLILDTKIPVFML